MSTSKAVPGPQRRRFGIFVLDLATGELWKKNTRLPLRGQPIQLLAVLLERPGQLVSRAELQERLWASDTFVDFDRGLNTSVNRLREALGDSASAPRYVETVPRRGYRFIAPVEILLTRADPGGETNDVTEAVPMTPTLVPPPKAEVARKPAVTVRTVLAVLAMIAAATALALILPLRRSAELKQRVLTSNSPEVSLTAAALSPDGKYLAYAQTADLYLQTLDTGQTFPLGPVTNYRIGKLDWFADGRRLLISAVAVDSGVPAVWIFSIIKDQPPRKLADDVWCQAVSPDGLEAVCDPAGAGREIRLLSLNTGGERTLVTAAESARLGPAWWSPDAQRLWYIQTQGLGGGKVTYAIESISRNGGSPVELVSAPSLNSGVAVRGGRVLYLKSDHPDENLNLWSVGADFANGRRRGEPRQISNWAGFGAAQLSASADGKHVVCLGGNSQPDVYVAALAPNGNAFSSVRRLTLDDAADYPHAWTRDSNSLIFESDRRHQHWDIYRQSLDRQTPETLAAGTEDAVDARATPDGNWLLYTTLPKGSSIAPGKPGSIMRVPITGGTPQLVSGERAYITYSCARAPATLCAIDERQGGEMVFRALDPERGEGRELARIPYNPAGGFYWDLSPDGTRIAVAAESGEEGRIEVIALDGRPRYLVRVPGWSHFHSIAWTADGRGWFVSSMHGRSPALLHVDINGDAHMLGDWFGTFRAWPVPSPDGRYLAYAVHAISWKAWLLEDF